MEKHILDKHILEFFERLHNRDMSALKSVHDGLCFNLSIYLENKTHEDMEGFSGVFISDLAKGWPKYSGMANYPVPSDYERRTANEAFHYSTDKYDTTNQYGCDRWELVDHIYSKIVAHQKETKNEQL